MVTENLHRALILRQALYLVLLPCYPLSSLKHHYEAGIMESKIQIRKLIIRGYIHIHIYLKPLSYDNIEEGTLTLLGRSGNVLRRSCT